MLEVPRCSLVMMRNQTWWHCSKRPAVDVQGCFDIETTWMETNPTTVPPVHSPTAFPTYPTVFSWRSLWFRWRSILWWYLSRSGMSTLCRDMALYPLPCQTLIRSLFAAVGCRPSGTELPNISRSNTMVLPCPWNIGHLLSGKPRHKVPDSM